MRSVVRGVIVGLVVLGALGAVASRAGWIVVDVPRFDGTFAWVLSRATGYAAYLALALDVAVGLLVSARAGDRFLARGHAVELHRWLSPLGLALVLGHAVVLLADRYVRFDLLDVAVPFVSSYRPVAVGLGVVAAYLAVVVHASFAFRRQLGTPRWRKLHALSFVAFAGATLHAVLAGSDAWSPWALALVGAPLAIVVVLLVRRIRGKR
ncbi:MAG TPA: hypothetical protein VFQ53_04910 [Kofleriaceae bacterium]|nr:hypothetical protein [Kofleriaceae bacterium]